MALYVSTLQFSKSGQSQIWPIYILKFGRSWAEFGRQSYYTYARILKLELSRESRVIPGTGNSSVLATTGLGLSSE